MFGVIQKSEARVEKLVVGALKEKLKAAIYEDRHPIGTGRIFQANY